MSSDPPDPSFIKRAYDRIWLLAVVAFVFWLVTYLIWGLLDIFTVPVG